MTTVYIDPIHGAALTAGLLPILPGLPCPTCRGTGWRCRNSNLMCTHRVHQGCEDCTGSGVWTPPDHPVTIGVTSATADAMLDQDERMHEAGYDIGIIGDQRSGWELATRPPGEEWTSGNTIKHPIVLSSVIGEGTLRKLKVITDDDIRPAEGSYIIHDGYGRLTLWPEFIDISSALPFLPGLKPGDTVYLADGFTDSVECHECDKGWIGERGPLGIRTTAGVLCRRCKKSPGRLSCPFPVDALGHPLAPMPRAADDGSATSRVESPPPMSHPRKL